MVLLGILPEDKAFSSIRYKLLIFYFFYVEYTMEMGKKITMTLKGSQRYQRASCAKSWLDKTGWRIKPED